MARINSERFWGSTRTRTPRFAPRLEGLEDRCTPVADVVLEWNSVMLQANANDHARAAPEQGGPVLTGRAFAIASAAMYDAFNSVEHIGGKYLVFIPGVQSANEDAAVAQAAHDTLAFLYPSQRAAFDANLRQTLDQIPDGNAETLGRIVGAVVAGITLASRANDGAANIGTPPYVPNGLPGFHNVDPLHPGQGFYAPGGGNVTPFGVQSNDQFSARRLDNGTPAGRAAFLRSSEYTAAFNEVKRLGGDGVTTPTVRTPEQTQIGVYWGYDGRPGLGTPPRLYNQIARTVAEQEGNTEADNARLFALLNIAMADAGFACWDDKYELAFWRPVLGVRGGGADGNPNTVGDPNWTPLGAPASNPRPGETDFTPPFPAYTSGHATFGAAAFQTLARFYGRDDISFTFTSDELNGVTRGDDGVARPLAPRTFDSFTEAKRENAQSRIYLGIHWRFDADEGVRQGNQIANYVFDHILSSSGQFQATETAPEAETGGGAAPPTLRASGTTGTTAETPTGTAVFLPPTTEIPNATAFGAAPAAVSKAPDEPAVDQTAVGGGTAPVVTPPGAALDYRTELTAAVSLGLTVDPLDISAV